MNKSSLSSLKADARAILAGKWSFAAGIFLIELFCNLMLEKLVDFAFPMRIAAGISVPHMLCLVIIGLISAILSAGSAYLYLNICRGRQYETKNLFYGFSNQPEHIVGWYFTILAIGFLFSVIPVTSLFFLLHTGELLWIVLLVISSLVCIAGFFCITLRYVMFPYLYADSPWKSSRELMQESRQMMKGQKGRYFYLQLSYIGLMLLGILSLGIGFIWISPYISAANARFYLDLKQGS